MCSVPDEVAVVEGPRIPEEEEQFDPTETLRAARLRGEEREEERGEERGEGGRGSKKVSVRVDD